MLEARHDLGPTRSTDLAPPEDATEVFESLESGVRLYSRKFPAVFARAHGSRLYTEDGRVFIDFFCGAGALNYGHNDDRITRRLIDYLKADGIIHGLDMYTVAKRDFLRGFRDLVLRPRKLSYRVQFCGPTGTNAVEAALKLARRVTGRSGLVAFSGSYHGMSRGSLAVTGAATRVPGRGRSPTRSPSSPMETDLRGPSTRSPTWSAC